jgi:hypothetical protein
MIPMPSPVASIPSSSSDRYPRPSVDARTADGTLSAPLAAGLAALGLSAIVSALQGSRTGAVMFALCFAGVVAAWWLGARRASLTVLAASLTVLVWLFLTGSFGHARVVTTAAHAIASALVAWILVGILDRRLGAEPGHVRAAALGALAATMVVGLGWEAAEWSADALTGTDLALTVRDTVMDLVFDFLGACAGVIAAVRLRGYRDPSQSRVQRKAESH